MLYCSQCGNQVNEKDIYCTRCGAKQPVSMPFAPQSVSDTISDRTACVLCYIPFVGWVVAIIVLASLRFRDQRVVRFHAFQALYLFVAWLLLDWVIAPIMLVGLTLPMHFTRSVFPHLGVAGLVKLVELCLIMVSVYMMVRAHDEEALRLPVIGDLAEKSL